MSNRTEHHDKIQQITAKLIELNNNFANAAQLTSVDIELLRKYTVDLYDELLLLKPEKGITVQPNIPTPVPTIINPVVKEESRKNVAPEPIVEEKTIPPPPTEIPTPIEEPRSNEVIVPTVPTEIKPIAKEKKEETDNSLNTSLQKPESEDLASKLGQTPVHDLKKAISINKKFEFISQLFGGDHEGYTKSIHHLNGLKNKDDAMTFFNHLKKENNWDEENKRFIEFADLVNRRFM